MNEEFVLVIVNLSKKEGRKEETGWVGNTGRRESKVESIIMFLNLNLKSTELVC